MSKHSEDDHSITYSHYCNIAAEITLRNPIHQTHNLTVMWDTLHNHQKYSRSTTPTAERRDTIIVRHLYHTQ